MVRLPVHSSQPPTSAAKFLNEGSLKIGDEDRLAIKPQTG